MEQDYEIFERLPDASVRCLVRVHGACHVPTVLKERAKRTTNECFAMNTLTGEILPQVNNQVARRTDINKTTGTPIGKTRSMTPF
jgi:hypothetical protein